MQTAGWINYRTPIKPFDPPRLSVLGSLPETEGTTMTWNSSNGDRLTLTVEFVAKDQRPRALLAIQFNHEQVNAILDPEKLRTGRPLSECFQMTEIGNSTLLRRLPELLQALPSSRVFNSAGPTWVPSKSDPTKAWKVERAAARVLVDDPEFGKCWHRCDVMYCDQIPFGVLQWKTTVTSDATGEVLSTKTWLAEQH